MSIEIYFHIGLPKCGSTAIQSSLYNNRHDLQKEGILYPLSSLVVEKDYGANHQLLISALLINDTDKVFFLINAAIDEAKKNNCSSVIFSHEGFTNHYYDFKNAFIEVLTEISTNYLVRIIIVTRPILGFFIAYYKQNIINPPINDNLGYGLDITTSDFFYLDRIQKLLNYHFILGEIKNVSDKIEMVVVKHNKKDLLRLFYKTINSALVADDTIFINRSLSDRAIEFIRKKNNDYKNQLSEREIFIAAIRKGDTDDSLVTSTLIDDKLKNKIEAFEKEIDLSDYKIIE